MPQILLEYSSNISELITEDFPYKIILKEIHRILNEIGKIKLENCKSRVLSHSHYYIADGATAHAMLHIEISFMEGRSDALKNEMGETILHYLHNYLNVLIPEYKDQLKVQITVHFQDMLKSAYFKYPSGTI